MDLLAGLRRNAWRLWERYVVTHFVLSPRNNTGARPIWNFTADSPRFRPDRPSRADGARDHVEPDGTLGKAR